MKKWLIFGGGIVTGVFLSFVVLLIIGAERTNNGGLFGATMFDKPQGVVYESSFKVFQVVKDNAALVNSKDKYGDYNGTLYLMINNAGHYYYDDEIIKVPSNKVVRQIGRYKYNTRIGYKTVPIIKIMD